MTWLVKGMTLGRLGSEVWHPQNLTPPHSRPQQSPLQMSPWQEGGCSLFEVGSSLLWNDIKYKAQLACFLVKKKCRPLFFGMLALLKLSVHNSRFFVMWPQTKCKLIYATIFWFSFYALSHGSLGFAFHGSFFNHSLIGENSSTANKNLCNGGW